MLLKIRFLGKNRIDALEFVMEFLGNVIQFGFWRLEIDVDRRQRKMGRSAINRD